MTTARVSRKGWVVIPHEIRERHRIRPGDEVHVIDYGGRITIVPVAHDPIAAGLGMVKGGASMTKALVKERRAEMKREEKKIERWVSGR